MDTVEISDEARRLATEASTGEGNPPVPPEASDEPEEIDTLQKALEKFNAAHASGTGFGRDEALSEMDRMKQQLENLRTVFGDKVALQTFDDRMGNSGYSFSVQVGIGSLYFAPSETRGLSWIGYSEPGKASWDELGITEEDSNYDSNGSLKFKVEYDYDREKGFGTVSIVRNGQTEATYAAFNAYKDPGYEDAKRIWNERTATFQEENPDFDVLEYVKNLKGKPGDGPLAVESVSTGLADTVSSILRNAGITLNKGQELTLLAGKNDGEYNFVVSTNYGNEVIDKQLEQIFLKAFEKDPSLKDQFISEYESVERYDVDSFPGQFYSENRSVFYDSTRQFIYSGDDPSAVVMGSSLNLRQSGQFIYLKEIS